MLIFVAGHAPIYGCQILYFQDPTFSARSKVEPPKVSDRIRFHDPIAEIDDIEFKLA